MYDIIIRITLNDYLSIKKKKIVALSMGDCYIIYILK